jgi:membrane protein YdbS with pleckstrin-like domain
MPKIVLRKQNWFFDGKEDEEDVILVLHRHVVTLVAKITLIVFFAFLPFVFLVVFSSVIVKYNLISVYSFAWITYYLFLWFWLFYVITMYSLDNWVVTTKRVVDSLQTGFFNRRVAELQLDKIQDVSYKVQGLIPTFFNYGLVEIQTASKDNKFFFEQVPNPQRVKDVIMELIIEEEEETESGGDNKHPHPHRHVLVANHGIPTHLVTENAEDVAEVDKDIQSGI